MRQFKKDLFPIDEPSIRVLKFMQDTHFFTLNKKPVKNFCASFRNFCIKYSFPISIPLLFSEVNMTVMYRQANDDTEGELGNRWDTSMDSTK